MTDRHIADAVENALAGKPQGHKRYRILEHKKWTNPTFHEKEGHWRSEYRIQRRGLLFWKTIEEQVSSLERAYEIIQFDIESRQHAKWRKYEVL